MNIPSDYEPGYEKACALDPKLAKTYVEHTQIGDPLADAAAEALAEIEREKSHQLITAGMEEDEAGFKDAPEALKKFFDHVSNPPFVFDPDKAMVASKAFYKDSDMFFLGLALNTLIGLTEGLSKPFYVTGRATSNLRRFRQNTRHLLEITLPGGLDRFGEGWKLSVRIRIIHAQLRRLLSDSDEWDVAAEGTPLHAAHMALGITGFSAINLHAARRLGVPLTKEECDGFMHIWHYTAWLMGIPDVFLSHFHDEDDALYLRKIAHACEVPPGEKATAVAHGYVDAIPALLHISDPVEKRKLYDVLYRVARILLGDHLADTFGFPKRPTFGILQLLRMQRNLKRFLYKVMPSKSFIGDNFADLLRQAAYDDAGINYRMPDALKEAQSSPW